MGIINNDWYDANESRPYPLDDAATAVDASGIKLPSNIIVDMNVRYPQTLGDYPFIASVTVTAKLVSVTLQVASDPNDASTFVPLAVYSSTIIQAIPGRHLPLLPQTDGVGGWIVFGDGLKDQPYSGRFKVPSASLISARACRQYSPLPVKSLAKLYNATPLYDVVRLSGSQPIEIVGDSREIDGILRKVAVIRLVEQPGNSAVANSTSTTSVFDTFSGPCAARPESGNCGEWQPMQSVNAVSPDCTGNITIEFRGCAQLALVQQECGIVVDCSLSLSDVCVTSQLPTPDGKLPNDYPDLCAPSLSSSASQSGTSSHSQSLPEIPSASIPHVVGALPYSQTFDDGTAMHWKTINGVFSFSTDDSPGEFPIPVTGKSYTTEGPNYGTQQHISLWEGFDHITVHRRYVTDIKMMPGNVKHNAGLVINYRPLGIGSTDHVFFLVNVDYDTQEFGIDFYNGNAYIPSSAVAQLATVQLDAWYRIDVEVTPIGGSNVQISAELSAVADDGSLVLIALIVLTTTMYYPDTGYAGFHADRAATRFAFLHVREI